MIRLLFALIGVATALFAHDSSPVTACGPKDVSFDVQVDASHSAVMPPEAGKALVYVIQEDGVWKCIGWGCTTTKVALDGVWIGANRHNSYFSFTVSPGERHVCVALQSAVVPRLVGLVHFTAEEGKVYYFRTRTFGGENRTFLDFEPIDSDQGKFLTAAYPASIAHARK